MKLIKGFLLTVTIVLPAIAGSFSQASDQSLVGDWKHSATLYVWLPAIDGELKYQREAGDDTLQIDTGQILDALNMTFMGTYESRKNRWFFLGDLIYLDLGDDKNRDTIGYDKVTLDLNGWQIGAYGGYNLLRSSSVNLDLVAGLRYLTIETEANLSSDRLPDLDLTEDADLWDGVVGLKGDAKINENWYLSYHADVGTGDSNLTWQALSGIGFHADWGDVALVYRFLKWDQDKDKFVQELSFRGPVIALKFCF
jgi:hypothetical protein